MHTFALIGAGFISARHIDAIKHIGGQLVAVVDIDETRKIPDIPFFLSHHELAKSPVWQQVKNVIICTPNDTHVKLATWAVSQGKRVLCEKPIGLDAGELVKISGVRDVYAVMQLRHHPVMEELRKVKAESVSLFVKVKRGTDYWTGWKGDTARSGGILFNLGVHYFDVLFQLFGNNCFSVELDENTKKKVTGRLRFYGLAEAVNVHVEICADGEGQDRYIEINGVRHRFSDKDNLSFEDLHKKVYEELVQDRGVQIRDLVDLTRFIERMKRHHV